MKNLILSIATITLLTLGLASCTEEVIEPVANVDLPTEKYTEDETVLNKNEPD